LETGKKFFHLSLFVAMKRPPPGALNCELIALIRRMWQTNPTWGSPRIQAELAKLGIYNFSMCPVKIVARETREPFPSQSVLTNQTV
jgi:hypothetical protein